MRSVRILRQKMKVPLLQMKWMKHKRKMPIHQILVKPMEMNNQSLSLKQTSHHWRRNMPIISFRMVETMNIILIMKSVASLCSIQSPLKIHFRSIC